MLQLFDLTAGYGDKQILHGLNLQFRPGELTAVIEALGMLKEPCEVELVTDSKYLADAVTQGWLEGWRFRGWRRADKKPVLNPELWQRLSDLLDIHKVTFEWVKGHAGHKYNELCDSMAVGEYQKYLKGSN